LGKQKVTIKQNQTLSKSLTLLADTDDASTENEKHPL